MYFRSRLDRIDTFIQQPVAAQHQTLRELLHKGQGTVFGRQFLAGVKDYQSFRQMVPLQDYESHQPYFERMRRGERDVLWPGSIRWFAKSSGTSGAASKFIPISAEGLKKLHIGTGKDYLSCYLRNVPHSVFFEGKGLVMGGSISIDPSFPKVFCGDVSAIMMKNLPGWIQHFRTPGLAVALIDSWERKLDAIAKESVGQNITNLSGVPSWTLLLLERVLQLTKSKVIAEVWPNLEFYAHGGVSMKPYLPAFQQRIGKPIHYLNIYNASEGFFAFQDQLDDDAMLLDTDNGTYYEFIPLKHTDSGVNAIPLEDVKPGIIYAMVVTTNCGLWRYQIGDTVEFVSVRPYRLRIVGRTQHFINVAGEEVMVSNTDQALAMTCNELHLMVKEYTAAPNFISGKVQFHEWAIEFATPPDDLKKFQDLLDKNLQNVNSDYAAKRTNDLILSQLRVHVLSHGTFYKWQDRNKRLGGQQKIMRLSNNRDFLDIILHLK